MHAIKGGWNGQIFALSPGNDSGGRKSRIRRTKEERKAMVESFIKKYQKLNNGNFPSLNLAHKEVGGSFYTVREIVREIIQENRVLAPPKESTGEQDHSGFLEQHPLGSISVEPQMELSGSDRIHTVTHTVPNKYQITSEEDISNSAVQFCGSYPSELDNEQISEGIRRVVSEEVSDGTSRGHSYQDTSIEKVSNCRGLLAQPKSCEFENERIINGVDMLEENPYSDKPAMANVDCQENSDTDLLYSEKFNGPRSQRLSEERHLNEADHLVDKTREFKQRIFSESVFMETLDREKHGAKDVEASQTVTSHMNSNIVVEKFPLRPLPRISHKVHGESGELHKSAGKMENKAIQHDQMTFVQSSSGFVNEKDEKQLPDSTVELKGQFEDEKLVLNLHDPSLGCSKDSTTSKLSVLDVGDVTGHESEDSLHNVTKASGSNKQLICEDSTSVGRKFSNQDNRSLPKQDNSTVDRINLKTSEGASRKSTRPENNPLLALLEALISSFEKFWTK